MVYLLSTARVEKMEMKMEIGVHTIVK